MKFGFTKVLSGLAVAVAAAMLPAEEIITASYAAQPPVIDGRADDAAWQKAGKLVDVKNFRGDITMTLQSVYDREKLYLLLDVNHPDVLGAPDMELLLRPVIRDHRPMALVRSGREYFSIKFNNQGVVASDYDGAVILKTAPNGSAGCRLEIALDLPQTMEWLPQVPKVGDYYEVAVRFKYPSVQRYAMYFFTNHYNELGRNMGKIMLAGNETIERPMLFFDREATCFEQLKRIADHLAELKLLKASGAVAAGEERLQKWHRHNESLNDRDYQEQRRFQARELDKLEADLRQARIAALTADAGFRRNGVLFFPVPCYNDAIRPDNFTLPAQQLVADRNIAMKVAPGEIDSFSCAVWTTKELRQVSFEVAPFTDASGKTAAAEIENFYVKNWYQGQGYTELTQSKIVLMPELLVKNNDLVQCDYENQRNLLQLHHNGRVERLYPDDSKELLPIRRLAPEFLQQFWTRFRFPDDAKPGRYTSRVTVTAGGRALASLPVTVEILPFQLGKSPIRSQVYTLSRWGEKSDELALTEITSLARHGLDTVGLFENADTLPHVVELMKKGGLSVERIYLQGDGDFVFYPDMPVEKIREIVANGLKVKAIPGVKEVYFYLPDEAMGDKLKKSIPIAEEIHRLGGKTWGAASRGWLNVPGADKIFNHMNQSGPPPIAKELTERVHRDGNEVFCYNFPQGGLEAPQRYRRHFGFLMYGAGYDGVMTWSWWWPYEGAEYDCWNEFNEHFWKQHCMVYPTRNGVVDTVQYEGWAKGINDLRYLGALLEAREELKNQPELAAKIDRFIADLQRDPYEATVDQEAVRNQIIALLMECTRIKGN